MIEASARAIEVPVLFLMQLEDELFDRASCLALFDALATEDKRLHANAGLHPEVPIHLYPAGHGFNCDLRGSYHAESAALARERSLAFLAEHLK